MIRVSLSCRLAQAVRSPWGIENQLHWVLNVRMGEDDSRVRVGHAAENLATLRKIALNLLRRDTQTKVGTRAKQLKASWDHAYLQSLFKLCCVCPAGAGNAMRLDSDPA